MYVCTNFLLIIGRAWGNSRLAGMAGWLSNVPTYVICLQFIPLCVCMYKINGMFRNTVIYSHTLKIYWWYKWQHSKYAHAKAFSPKIPTCVSILKLQQSCYSPRCTCISCSGRWSCNLHSIQCVQANRKMSWLEEFCLRWSSKYNCNWQLTRHTVW